MGLPLCWHTSLFLKWAGTQHSATPELISHCLLNISFVPGLKNTQSVYFYSRCRMTVYPANFPFFAVNFHFSELRALLCRLRYLISFFVSSVGCLLCWLLSETLLLIMCQVWFHLKWVEIWCEESRHPLKSAKNESSYCEYFIHEGWLCLWEKEQEKVALDEILALYAFF